MLYSSSCIHIVAPFRTDRCNTTPHKCLQAHTILRLNDLVTQHLTHVVMFIACEQAFGRAGNFPFLAIFSQTESLFKSYYVYNRLLSTKLSLGRL